MNGILGHNSALLYSAGYNMDLYYATEMTFGMNHAPGAGSNLELQLDHCATVAPRSIILKLITYSTYLYRPPAFRSNGRSYRKGRSSRTQIVRTRNLHCTWPAHTGAQWCGHSIWIRTREAPDSNISQLQHTK